MTARNMPPVVSRTQWLAAIDTLRGREKAHTKEGDATLPRGDGCP